MPDLSPAPIAVAQARRAVTDASTFLRYPPDLRRMAWAVLQSARGGTAAPLQRRGQGQGPDGDAA